MIYIILDRARFLRLYLKKLFSEKLLSLAVVSSSLYCLYGLRLSDQHTSSYDSDKRPDAPNTYP